VWEFVRAIPTIPIYDTYSKSADNSRTTHYKL